MALASFTCHDLKAVKYMHPRAGFVSRARTFRWRAAERVANKENVDCLFDKSWKTGVKCSRIDRF